VVSANPNGQALVKDKGEGSLAAKNVQSMGEPDSPIEKKKKIAFKKMKTNTNGIETILRILLLGFE